MPCPTPHRIEYIPVTEEVRNHYLELAPWTKKILDSTKLKSIATSSRAVHPTSNYCRFTSVLLAGDRAQPVCQSFWFTELQPLSSSLQNSPTASTANEVPTISKNAPDHGYLALLSVFEDVAGPPNAVHGGMIATILDDACRSWAELHREIEANMYTAFLNIRFKKPVALPGVVMSRAWRDDRSTGHKMFIKALVEDGSGDVCAEADCLFVEKPGMEPKL